MVLYCGGWQSWLYRRSLSGSSTSRYDLFPLKGMKYMGGWPSWTERLHASLSICASLYRWHALQKLVQNRMERPTPRMPRKMLEEEEEGEDDGDTGRSNAPALMSSALTSLDSPDTDSSSFSISQRQRLIYYQELVTGEKRTNRSKCTEG